MSALCFAGNHQSCPGCNCSCHARGLFDYDLYDGTPPHVAGDTSSDAANAIRPSASHLEDVVVAHIAQQDDATCDELEVLLGLSHQTCSARVREAVLHDRIYDTGRRRRTRSGRMARVYTVYRGVTAQPATAGAPPPTKQWQGRRLVGT